MHLGRVIGKFKLEKRLGHGAMGDVFLGVQDASKAMNLAWLSDGWFFDFGATAGSMSVTCP